jgi:UDP-N-acetyl-D-mannosaminuronic acid dehydrogenase
MSSSILRVTPEEVDTVEKRGKYVISIIGCGQVGVLHACLLAEAGFKVICTDTDQTLVNQVTRGRAPFSKPEIESELKKQVKPARISATSDTGAAVSQSDIIIITIPVKIDEKKKPTFSDVESTCKRVGSSLRRDSLVIVTNVAGVNIIEGLVKELLENTSGFKVGTDLGLAYSPVHFTSAQTLETAMSHQRMLAAGDKNSLNAASTILEIINRNGIKKTGNIKTAEIATLFEAVQEDVNVALANEFALLCEKTCIDYLEARKLLESLNYPRIPMPTLTDGDTQTKVRIILEEAENVNAKLRITKIARDTNEEMVGHAVNLAKDALRNCGKTLRRARVSLLGISKTPNTKDSPKEEVKKLVEMLDVRGAKVSLYDPYFSSEELAELQGHFKKNLNEAIERADCIMILTGHDQFKRINLNRLKVMMKTPASIVDLEGIIEPDKVEKEGFIYRGLGRGVWTR